MLLFIGSEIMFFAGLFAAYFNARATAQPHWPPEGQEHFIDPFTQTPLPFLPTDRHVHPGRQLGHDAVGAVAHPEGRSDGHEPRADRHAAHGRACSWAPRLWDYTTLAGEGFGINSGIYGTLFFTMTGFHGAHVFGGVVGIAVVLLRGLAGQFSARHHVAVEAVSAYWHFVDVVWIFLFLTLYFLK